jgi:hypothetical protein
MDDSVLRSIAKWPNVPAVYGWLALDRRGNWLIRMPGAERFERIVNSALREFIARNYECDERGAWFFQNGPQRVYVRLAYTPYVVHFDGEAPLDHCGRPFGEIEEAFVDEEGSVLLRRGRVIALVDDRDLERFAEGAERLTPIASADVAARFGFLRDPAPAPASGTPAAPDREPPKGRAA